jgi:putative glutamine amidotransferase
MERDSRSSVPGPTNKRASASTSSSRPDAPLVGITHSLDRRRDGEIIDEPAAYVAALQRHGARTEPLENDVARIESYLDRLDGIVVSGGLDVDPERYGGIRNETVDPPNPERDAFEIALVREARLRRIPLLGVCRGLQIANVALGGTLIEDLSGHRDVTHTVKFGSGALRALIGVESAVTNSMHHQAVRHVAAGLIAVGHAPDGTIEALEARFGHPFFFAVQWHPEVLPENDDVAQRLFAGLVRAARERSAASRVLDRA